MTDQTRDTITPARARRRPLRWLGACAVVAILLAVTKPFGVLLSATVVGVAGTAVFAVLERLWPGVRGSRWRRAGYATDVKFWFFGNIVARPLATAATLVTLVAVGLLLRTPLDGEAMSQ